MKSEWKKYQISDIANVVGGGTPKTSIEEYWKGNIPWLAPKDLTGYSDVYIAHGDRFITELGLQKSSSKLMPKGTVLLTSRAPIGYVAIAKNEICTNQGFKSLVPKEDFCTSEYLYYWIKNNVGYLKQLGTGTTFAEISGSVLKSVDITLPLLSTQKKIAHVLITLDDKIELNRKMNQTLEDMAQALFKSWFVDFDPVHLKAKCTSEEELEAGAKELGISKEILELFPSEFVESEMGMIPLGWEVKEIGDCQLEIESGRRPKGGIDKELQEGVPSVGAESIISTGHFDYGKVKYVTDEFALKAKKGWVKNLDVALYKDGGKPGLFMPRVALYGNSFPFENFMINEHVFLLRSIELGQYYLYSLVSSNGFLDQLIAKGSAKAAQPGLNQGEVKDTRFVLPSKMILQSFNKLSKSLVAKQLDNGKQIQTLQKTRDTLLPKLLSGELDVSEVEI